MRKHGFGTTLSGALVAALVLLASACAGDGSTVEPETPLKTPATAGEGFVFQVSDLEDLVAGDGHAWLVQHSADGAVVVDVDAEGRQQRLTAFPGDAHRWVPFRDLLAVTYYTCESDCSETVLHLTVIGRDGSVVDEHELIRLDRSPGSAEGAWIVGATDDLIWVSYEGVIAAYDPLAGLEVERIDGFRATCLFGEELFAVVHARGAPSSEEAGEEPQHVEVEIEHLVDHEWTQVPGSRRSVADVGGTCLAGVIDFGLATEAGLAWDPSSGWRERAPYVTSNELIVVTDSGQETQLFSIIGDGIVQRVYRQSQAVPLAIDQVELPAEHFYHDTTNVPPAMSMDQSDNIRIGCINQPPVQVTVDDPPSPSELRTPWECYIEEIETEM